MLSQSLHGRWIPIFCAALTTAMAYGCGGDGGPGGDVTQSPTTCQAEGKYGIDCRPRLSVRDDATGQPANERYEVVRSPLEPGATRAWRFRVQNVGNGVLTVKSLALVAASGDGDSASSFTCQDAKGVACSELAGRSLRGGEQAETLLIEVTYTRPAVERDEEAVLRIVSSEATQVVRFRSVKGEARFKLIPEMIDFGLVAVGQSKSGGLNIFNAGNLSLEISSFSRQKMGGTTVALKLGPNRLLKGDKGQLSPPLRVEPGASVALLGSYAPKDDLGVGGTLILTSNAGPIEILVRADQPPAGRLCRPCQHSSDCQMPGHEGARCVSYGPLGAFCGLACKASNDSACPEGYVCQLVDATEVGEQVSQCVAKPTEQGGAGMCGCSDTDIALKAATFCYVEHNDPKTGTLVAKCQGTRRCEIGGMSECIAAPPSAEICDGLDNDCNGVVDESTCDDGNPCTKDSCASAVGGGLTGCLHAPVTGVCEDGNKCTGPDTCLKSVCKAGAPLSCNDNNPCTQDMCDPKTGCVASPDDSETCDDGDPCTSGDFCKFGACQPGKSTTCDDGNPCTTDGCVPGTGCQHKALNGQTCDADGSLCTQGDKCVAGQCKTGQSVACDDNNPCTVDGCDPKTGMCSHKVMPDGVACDDGSTCTKADACFAGKCLGKGLVCEDNNPCTTDTCTPGGGCTFINHTKPCSDNDACTVADTCSDGNCTSGKALGCDDGNGCTDDSCAPKTGCLHVANTAACDDGSKCTTGDQCSQKSCKPGKKLICEDGNPCTADTCKPKTGCAHTAQGGSCDDGDACTKGDACKAGKCAGATSVSCDDSNPCTTDTCSTAGGCKHQAHTKACEDGDPCTVSDQCAGGSCVAGKAKSCDDNNVCTTDSCKANKGCVNAANSAVCDDGDACTKSDGCALGACMAGGKVGCDDGNVCTTDSCDKASGCKHSANVEPCDDGDACTSGDVCVGGNCTSGKALGCDDGNGCTDDSCAPKTGCVHVANAAACDDGSKCTTADQCSQKSCKPGKNLICEDGNPCTADTCKPKTGCAHTAQGGSCDDGDACTKGDACKAGKCAGATSLNCDDGNPCTTDTCSAAGGCKHQAHTKACEDGDPCTVSDQCAGGSCVAGKAKSCDDNNVCTTDSCKANKGCVNAANSAVCDDGDACTKSDGCASGACAGGGKVGCDDGNVCTTDSCDKASGCKHSANTNACSDGDACTLGEQCQGGQCQGSKPKDCGASSDACNVGVCGGSGKCTKKPKTASCSDGNPCTLNDLCAAGSCKAGKVKDCSALNGACTLGKCAGGGCVKQSKSGVCSDGDACTVGDQCVSGSCKSGAPKSCSYLNGACAVGVCGGGSCLKKAKSGSCSDGNSCTLNDYCSGGSCKGGSQKYCGYLNSACKAGVCSGGSCTTQTKSGSCSDNNNCTVNDYCSAGTCQGGGQRNCNDGNACTKDYCSGYCKHSNLSNGTWCGSGRECQSGQCVKKCVDKDGDGVCADKDCNDNDALIYPGAKEYWDVRDNDCDGVADEDGLVTLYRYVAKHSNTDWEHRYAKWTPWSQGGGKFYKESGRYLRLFPLNFCGGSYAPKKPCSSNDTINKQGYVTIWGGYTFYALSECIGKLGVNFITLYLPESSSEYTSYNKPGSPLACKRIGFVYAKNAAHDAKGSKTFWRQRSGFDSNSKGDNFWTTTPYEKSPWTYQTDGSAAWWAPGGH